MSRLFSKALLVIAVTLAFQPLHASDANDSIDDMWQSFASDPGNFFIRNSDAPALEVDQTIFDAPDFPARPRKRVKAHIERVARQIEEIQRHPRPGVSLDDLQKKHALLEERLQTYRPNGAYSLLKLAAQSITEKNEAALKRKALLFVQACRLVTNSMRMMNHCGNEYEDKERKLEHARYRAASALVELAEAQTSNQQQVATYTLATCLLHIPAKTLGCNRRNKFFHATTCILGAAIYERTAKLHEDGNMPHDIGWSPDRYDIYGETMSYADAAHLGAVHCLWFAGLARDQEKDRDNLHAYAKNIRQFLIPIINRQSANAAQSPEDSLQDLEAAYDTRQQDSIPDDFGDHDAWEPIHRNYDALLNLALGHFIYHDKGMARDFSQRLEKTGLNGKEDLFTELRSVKQAIAIEELQGLQWLLWSSMWPRNSSSDTPHNPALLENHFNTAERAANMWIDLGREYQNADYFLRGVALRIGLADSPQQRLDNNLEVLQLFDEARRTFDEQATDSVYWYGSNRIYATDDLIPYYSEVRNKIYMQLAELFSDHLTAFQGQNVEDEEVQDVVIQPWLARYGTYVDCLTPDFERNDVITAGFECFFLRGAVAASKGQVSED